MDFKNIVLKINNGAIYLLEDILKNFTNINKILFVSDSIVDKLYGSIVKKQILSVGALKEEIIDNNTISYAMNLAERIIATDIDCVVGVGGGKVLDVGKYAAYISKIPFIWF